MDLRKELKEAIGEEHAEVSYALFNQWFDYQINKITRVLEDYENVS